MSKMAKKKTRHEKILADQRHVTYHLETISAQVSLPSEKKESITPVFSFNNRPRVATLSYSYVLKDLRKTTTITFAILITQIILYFILNRI